MVKDEDTYPIGTIVRIRKTGLFAIIKQKTFQFEGRGFLNYLCEFEDKAGLYCVFHEDADLEALPQ